MTSGITNTLGIIAANGISAMSQSVTAAGSVDVNAASIIAIKL